MACGDGSPARSKWQPPRAVAPVLEHEHDRLFWNEESAGFDLYRARPGQNAGANLNDPGDDRPVRLPDRQELNVEARLNLAPLLRQKLELAVDFLNILNQRTATAFGQNDGQDAGVERAWMDPFRIRLRVNYRY